MKNNKNTAEESAAKPIERKKRQIEKGKLKKAIVAFVISISLLFTGIAGTYNYFLNKNKTKEKQNNIFVEDKGFFAGPYENSDVLSGIMINLDGMNVEKKIEKCTKNGHEIMYKVSVDENSDMNEIYSELVKCISINSGKGGIFFDIEELLNTTTLSKQQILDKIIPILKALEKADFYVGWLATTTNIEKVLANFPELKNYSCGHIRGEYETSKTFEHKIIEIYDNKAFVTGEDTVVDLVNEKKLNDIESLPTDKIIKRGTKTLDEIVYQYPNLRIEDLLKYNDLSYNDFDEMEPSAELKIPALANFSATKDYIETEDYTELPETDTTTEDTTNLKDDTKSQEIPETAYTAKGNIRGYDISLYQKNINFDKAKDQAGLLLIKTSEGALASNTNIEQIKKAIDYNIPICGYTIFSPNEDETIETNIENQLVTCKNIIEAAEAENKMLVLFLDIEQNEWQKLSNNDKKELLSAYSKKFNSKTNIKPGLYCSASVIKDIANNYSSQLTKFGKNIWVAGSFSQNTDYNDARSYAEIEDPTSFYAHGIYAPILQVCSKATNSIVDGYIDLNIIDPEYYNNELLNNNLTQKTAMRINSNAENPHSPFYQKAQIRTRKI